MVKPVVTTKMWKGLGIAMILMLVMAGLVWMCMNLIDDVFKALK